ncbi:hypothetical protein ACWGS9_19845 [Bradyrhizobium sp. Arg314]
MNAVVERLRASKAMLEQQQQPKWTEEGATWASDDADYDQLARVAEIVPKAYEALDLNGDWLLKELCRAVYNDPDPDAHQLNELTEALTGDSRTPISYAQLTWYIEGAQQVWEEVKDKI